MKLVQLPDLIVPDEYDREYTARLEIAILVRDRRRVGASNLSCNVSCTLESGSVIECMALGLPSLLRRINTMVRNAEPTPKPSTVGPWDQLVLPWDDLVEDD